MGLCTVGGPSKAIFASILVCFVVIGYGAASESDVKSDVPVSKINPPVFKKYQVTEGKRFSTRCFTTSFTVYWTNKESYRKKGAWLTFRKISREDAGLYYCYKNNDNLIQTVFLDVQYPAKITNITSEPDPVNKKGSFCLTLEVEGNPKPTTTLVSDDTGKSVFSECATGTVDIKYGPVQCSDSGKYTLTTRNAIGSDAQEQELLVYCPPSPSGRVKDSFIPRLGDNVKLQIATIGYPEPSFVWQFGGEVLKNDTEEADKDEYEIEDMKIGDFGVYFVKMYNEFGYSFQKYRVEPYGPPEPATQLAVNKTSVNSTVLSFKSGYDYENCQNFIIENCNGNRCTEIAEFADVSESHKPSSISHVLTGLESGKVYNLSVVSNNTCGQQRSACIMFKTDRQKQFTVTEGKPFRTRCPTVSLTAYWTNKKSFSKKGVWLNFWRISREDAGFYYCYKYKDNLVEAIYVDVQYSAKITNISDTPETTEVNKTICINLEVEGNPIPTTTLVADKTNKTVFSRSVLGEITFQTGRIKCSDGGKYTLTSKNSVGSDVVKRELEVFCPPFPDGKVKNKFKPRLGDSVRMKIASLGYPAPTYTWEFEGDVVKNGTAGDKDDYNIDKVNIDNYGTYTVTMENDYGTNVQSYKVKPDGPPEPAKKLEVSNTTSCSTELTFKSGYDYENCQNFIVENCNRNSCNELGSFDDDCEKHRPSKQSYTVSGLDPYTSYNISVVSNNTDGFVRSSSFVIVKTEAKTYTVVEGEPFSVKCPTKSILAYWTNKKLFIDHGTTLSFKSIDRRNAGSYYCYKPPRVLIEKINVNVLYQAKITKSPKQPGAVRQNSTITLNLAVEGNPAPVTTLVSDRTGKTVFSKCAAGKLTIEAGPVRCKDSGSYTLITKNSVGNDSMEGTLEVYCAPTVNGDVKTKFTPRLGDDVNLMISSAGYPEPTYTWKFGGDCLKNGTEGDQDNYKIKKVKIGDFGVYTVTMTNSLGSAKQNYYVTANGAPEPVTKLAVESVADKSAVLSFTSGFDYNHKQTFVVEAFNGRSYDDLTSFDDTSRNHKPSAVSKGIKKLEPGTTYNISITSKNSCGQKRSSAFVVFTTSINTKTDYAITEGSNLTLTCDSSDLNGTKVTNMEWQDAEGKEVSSTKVLKIPYIDRDQAGLYKCLGKTDFSSKMVVQEYIVDVQYPASFINQSVDDNYLEANETYVLELHVEGNPAPKLSFVKTRDGSVRFSETGSGFFNITMDPVKCSDMGFYNLTVNNDVGGETKRKNIYVYCPPVLDKGAILKKIFYPRVGSIVSMLIRNYGFPFPKYNWTYNKEKILQHTDNQYESTADVAITANDFGNYFVDMQNEYGLMDYSFEIIADGVPDPVQDLNITDVTDTSAKLTWIPGYDYGKQQTFNILMSKDGVYTSVANVTEPPKNLKAGLMEEKKMEYEITGLEGALEYNFTIESSNANGTSKMPEKPAVFNTPDDGPSAQTGDKVDEGAVVGGVLGGIAFIAILAVVGIFLMKKRRRTRYESLDGAET